MISYNDDGLIQIPHCVCCGARPRLSPIWGVYVGPIGQREPYCFPCERAKRTAASVELTPEARAFVARLHARENAA